MYFSSANVNPISDQIMFLSKRGLCLFSDFKNNFFLIYTHLARKNTAFDGMKTDSYLYRLKGASLLMTGSSHARISLIGTCCSVGLKLSTNQ